MAGRHISPEYQKRNQDLVVAYGSGKSVYELSFETGLSKRRVRSILEEAGVQLRNEPRRPPRHTKKYRDNRLVTIGAKLHAHRMKNGMTLPELAIAVGMSEVNLGDALQGLYNWRFVELTRAAKVMDISMETLIQLPEGVRC